MTVQAKDRGRFKRRRTDDEDNGEDWLLTYSDAVTLLMTFLVLLLSVSTIDQSKFDQVVESIKEQGLNQKEKYVSPFETLQDQLKEVMEKHELKDKMQVNRQPKGLTIELSSSSLYSVGSADIAPGSVDALKAVAQTIKEFDKASIQLEIEGHTDDVGINTLRYPSNWELSVHRATNIVRFLTSQGVEQELMKAAGYADTRPKVPNLDAQGNPIPENRAQNRRIVINVIRKEG